MSEHTKGPWRVRKWSAPMTIEGNIHQIAGDGDFPTAFVPAWDAPNAGEVDGTEEARANAALISAAPDMLEALIMLRDADDIGVKEGYTTMGPEQRACVDAAISKATGEPVELREAS